MAIDDLLAPGKARHITVHPIYLFTSNHLIACQPRTSKKLFFPLIKINYTLIFIFLISICW